MLSLSLRSSDIKKNEELNFRKKVAPETENVSVSSHSGHLIENEKESCENL